MVGIYFSGTGNSRFCAEVFLREYGAGEKAFSIEDSNALAAIKNEEGLLFCYPVQYSNIPKKLKDYLEENKALWRGKRVFVMATMGLFSGDGAGMLARLIKKYGAAISGGLHLKMPDNICDEKVLKRRIKDDIILVKKTEKKIKDAVKQIKNGRFPQQGLGVFSHLTGLFGQRLYFYKKTQQYSNKLKVNMQKCSGCGLCVQLCPQKSIQIKGAVAAPLGRCTLCYRCANACPKQAITLLGKRVVQQHRMADILPALGRRA